MRPTQQVPMKRKRFNAIEPKDLASSYSVHDHYCTLSELEFIVSWLHDIPLDYKIAEKLQKAKIISPTKISILEDPVSEIDDESSTASRSSKGTNHKKLKTSPASRDDRKAASSKESVELTKQPNYQVINLAQNHILYEDVTSPYLPKDVAETWSLIKKSLKVVDTCRNIDSINKALGFTQHTGVGGEGMIIKLLQDVVFPKSEDTLISMKNAEFIPELVPNPSGRFSVSTPRPDLTYAYDVSLAFTPAQQDIIFGCPRFGFERAHKGAFPVLVVEFVGNDPIWNASNQCLGATATCTYLTATLNRLPKRKSGAEIQTTVFSIAANAHEAVLHVSWEEDGHFVMKDLDFFHLRRQEEVLRLKMYVASILRWGRNQRLIEIRKALKDLWV